LFFLIVCWAGKYDSKVINKVFKNELNVSCTSSNSYKLPQVSFFNYSKELGIESLHNNLVLLVELPVLIIVKTFFKIKYWPMWSGTPLNMGIPEKSYSLVLPIKILSNNVLLQVFILVGK